MGALTDSVATAVADGLLPRGTAVLVACSGGADSVALAAAVAEHRELTLAVGHVDHALRPESAAEAEQVRALAARLGAPFYLERLGNLPVRSEGLEAAARAGRYAALARLAMQAGARVVATGHTRRDQAETLLLRLIRGAGPGALAGVRRRRRLAPGIELVRPILDVSRQETESFCREHGLSFTDDPHNSDPARARARLRELWPALLELNPRLEEALAGAADSLAAEDELLNALARDLPDLHNGHPALVRRALLQEAVAAGLRPDRAHLEQLRRLLAKGKGSLDLPGGRAQVEAGRVRFSKRPAHRAEPAGPPAPLAIPGPGSYAWQFRELVVRAGEGEGRMVDVSRAPFPWTLRAQRPGDRFRPAGGRTKKVADLWIDAGIPREERAGLALLEDAKGTLFWVEGLRESDVGRGPMSHIASFEIRPEMKPLAGRLTSERQHESRSATMDPRPDEEPR